VLAGQGAHLKTFHIPLLLIFPKQPALFLYGSSGKTGFTLNRIFGQNIINDFMED
jgi:hypothetical protein